MERLGGRECGEGVGKIQRYSNGVYQRCMWHAMCRWVEKKGSEWWNEEVGRAVAKKRTALEQWLHRRDRVTYDRYWAQRVVVKLIVQAAKRMADRRWGE